MKIVFVTPRFPHPLDKGDKLRAYHQLRQLSQRHDVHLCALSDEPVKDESIEEVEQYCSGVTVIRLSRSLARIRAALAIFGSRPLQVAYFSSPRACRALSGLLAREQPDHVLLQLARTGDLVEHLEWPATIDLMDAFSHGLSQRVALSPAWKRPILRTERDRLERYEHRLLDRFERVSIISQRDREALDHRQRDRIRIVPNGVDCEIFSPRLEAEADLRKDIDVLFVGNMSYEPNIVAARELVFEILPRVRETLSETNVWIVGAQPTAAVRELASVEGVNVSGWVDDITDYYARARAFVAPMRIGTGVQNKILQSFACAVPCVTTPLAKASIKAGSDSLLVGETSEELAHWVCRLLSEPELADSVGKRGRELALERFHWSAATEPLEDLILGATAAEEVATGAIEESVA